MLAERKKSNLSTVHFALIQAAVIHQSMYKFLHIDDQDMVKTNLVWPKLPGKKAKLVSMQHFILSDVTD